MRWNSYPLGHLCVSVCEILCVLNLSQDLIINYQKNEQNCVCASVCVSVSTLLYRHQ